MASAHSSKSPTPAAAHAPAPPPPYAGPFPPPPSHFAPPPGAYPHYYYFPPPPADGTQAGEPGAHPGGGPFMMALPPLPPGMVYAYPPMPPPGQLAPSATPSAPRPKRRQVKMACTSCAQACKRCDEQRPCERCRKYGIADTCIDGQRKERKKGVKRGPYKRKNKAGENDSPQDWPSPGAQQAPPHPLLLPPFAPPPGEAFFPPFCYPPMPPPGQGQGQGPGGAQADGAQPPPVQFFVPHPAAYPAFPHYPPYGGPPPMMSAPPPPEGANGKAEEGPGTPGAADAPAKKPRARAPRKKATAGAGAKAPQSPMEVDGQVPQMPVVAVVLPVQKEQGPGEGT